MDKHWMRGVMPPTKLLILVLWTVSACLQAETLCPFKADFKFYRSGMSLGKAHQQLTRLDEQRYQLDYHSYASFLFLSDKRQELSQFTFINNQLQPQQYQYSRTGTGKDHHLTVRFDKTSKTMSINDQALQPWQDQLDNQLYILGIELGLKKQQTDFAFSLVSDRGELEHYQFKAEGKEQLDLPYGKVSAIKVARIRKNSTRETFMWFAPDLNYQLVRIRQLKDGDEQGDLKLSHYQAEQCPSSPDN